MADNITPEADEHKAFGEALAMLTDLMIAIVVHESRELAFSVIQVHQGDPARWNRCWQAVEDLRVREVPNGKAR